VLRAAVDTCFVHSWQMKKVRIGTRWRRRPSEVSFLDARPTVTLPDLTGHNPPRNRRPQTHRARRDRFRRRGWQEEEEGRKALKRTRFGTARMRLEFLDKALRRCI
jgi:hypothetical protein